MQAFYSLLYVFPTTLLYEKHKKLYKNAFYKVLEAICLSFFISGTVIARALARGNPKNNDWF